MMVLDALFNSRVRRPLVFERRPGVLRSWHLCFTNGDMVDIFLDEPRTVPAGAGSVTMG